MTSNTPDPIKADFRNFLFLVWQHLGLPPPTPVQYEIAHFLQHGGKATRKMVQAFRGVGKSWITSAFVCWLLYCDPQLKILVVSASKTRSDDFSTFTKRLIHEMPLLINLKPKEGQRDSNVAFDVGPSQAAHAPSVKSVGITGQITGSRADVIIADDIETSSNSLTQMMRDKLLQVVKEFDSVLTPKPESMIVYLGTPQSEMSIYKTLPERGFKVRIWTGRFPKPKQVAYLGDTLAPSILEKLEASPGLCEECNGRGAPVDTRFNDRDLLEREASIGRSDFALQFMLDTSISDGDRFPLKLLDLVVMSIDKDVAPIKVAWSSGPEYAVNHLPVVGLNGDRYQKPMYMAKDFIPYQGVVMAIDPSGRGADETGYAVVAMLNGYLYVMEAGGLSGGYADETLDLLAKIAKRNKVKDIIIESNFGDGMFTKLFSPWLMKNSYPCTVEEVRHSVQKEKRIVDTLEPLMNQHRLVFDEAVIQNDVKHENPKYQLMYQMTRMTRERGALTKDDRIDALAIAVAYWVENMDRDTSMIEDEWRDQMLDEELSRFMEAATGQSLGHPNWTQNY